METKNKQVTSTYKNARISPRKTYPVANAVRGKSVDQAMIDLSFQKNKASGLIYQVLMSAVANAENNYSMNRGELFVEDIKVGPGITMKRARFAAKGRFKPILKRNTNITVVLNKDTKKEKSEIVKKEDKIE